MTFPVDRDRMWPSSVSSRTRRASPGRDPEHPLGRAVLSDELDVDHFTVDVCRNGVIVVCLDFPCGGVGARFGRDNSETDDISDRKGPAAALVPPSADLDTFPHPPSLRREHQGLREMPANSATRAVEHVRGCGDVFAAQRRWATRLRNLRTNTNTNTNTNTD